jgi:UDP-N-acetylmuramate dehydrogenase
LAESLQSRNTLRLRSSAPALLEISDLDELDRVLRARPAHEPLPRVLGEGSNVVLCGALQRPVLRFTARGRRVLEDAGEDVLLRIGAGENWHALTAWTLAQGYFGLENLALIPGTVGAAPIQNIGAYGVELAERVQCVHGVQLEDGRPFSLPAEACGFAYRDSLFKRAWQDRCLITAVDLRLCRRDRPRVDYPALGDWLEQRGLKATARSVFDAVVALRRARLPDPAQLPNAGSFFHNPVVDAVHAQQLRSRHPQMPQYPQSDGRVKLAAGWLIEQCGWKGFREGGVGVHSEHALVLLNLGADEGEVLLALAARIQDSVRSRFGCELNIEPRIYRD